MKSGIFTVVCAAALGLAVVGCDANGRVPETKGVLRVTATTTKVADLVRQVGGDRVEVAA